LAKFLKALLFKGGWGDRDIYFAIGLLNNQQTTNNLALSEVEGQQLTTNNYLAVLP
jgi:hypothetical protein